MEECKAKTCNCYCLLFQILLLYCLLFQILRTRWFYTKLQRKKTLYHSTFYCHVPFACDNANLIVKCTSCAKDAWKEPKTINRISEFDLKDHDFKEEFCRRDKWGHKQKQTTSNSVFLWVKDFKSQSTVKSWLKFYVRTEYKIDR